MSADTRTASSGIVMSTRDRIIVAAGDCVDRLGLERCTVAAIAQSAGVHRVTVYRHFADREAIIVELLDQRSAPLLQRAKAKLVGLEPFPDKLVDAISSAVYDARITPGLKQVMGFWIEGGSFRSAGMSERLKQRAIDVTSRYLLEAQQRGYVRAVLSVEDMIQWLLDVSLILLLFKPDYDLDEIRHYVRTFALPGIQAPA
ncbi:TetR/AcrR family transcriptional regulator [Mycobacterium seoulense]